MLTGFKIARSTTGRGKPDCRTHQAISDTVLETLSSWVKSLGGKAERIRAHLERVSYHTCSPDVFMCRGQIYIFPTYILLNSHFNPTIQTVDFVLKHKIAQLSLHAIFVCICVYW